MPTPRVIEVSVPASSANLGPGFDSLGLALGFRDVVRVEVADRLEITVEGSGSGDVALDETHLVHRALAATFEQLGRPVPPVRLSCRNRIPHGRGLGSSSAAIVAGIVAARALVPGGSLVLDDRAALDLAGRLEGHADNVAPALLGGFTVAYETADGYHATQLAVDPRIRVVVLVPAEAVKTTAARALLPAQVPHRDAARNAGRAALLVAALTGRPELLMDATEDALHQDYRRPAMPGTCDLVTRLRAQGVPAVISGAGPSVLAFVGERDVEQVAALAPVGWEPLALAVDLDGAQVC
ncbi:homoserine kinase [Nocardioides massiliensis]|uniref:Homoserine kinase n=1 Tax=Nocardioides massiliensis TaxID=1325935 RepID=A0ABT9NVJ9_9ACTN|nr:homoserine kinase [Nocardioides massiliensis]MDP9823850.1 homoserine kinase [Nocardioides massiliensis]